MAQAHLQKGAEARWGAQANDELGEAARKIAMRHNPARIFCHVQLGGSIGHELSVRPAPVLPAVFEPLVVDVDGGHGGRGNTPCRQQGGQGGEDEGGGERRGS